MSIPKALIVSCAGKSLSQDERRLFGAANPFGLILFSRNIDNPTQVKALTDEFRACVGRMDAPVFIDQEGGRVARMRHPHWEEFPAAAALGELYQIDPVRGIAAGKLLGRMLAAQLLQVGITVDCTPVLDIPVADANGVIGDRAFAKDPRIVTALGRAVCDGLRVGGVLPVMKHIPGHGRAMVDSHEELPTVGAAPDLLADTDFVPFEKLADIPLAMTAHIVYSEIDPAHCATMSTKVIEGVIRQQLGFEGLLISDDVCMNALQGSLPQRTRRVLDAGCDVALVCQNSASFPPDTKVLQEALEAAGPLSEAAQRRWKAACDWLRPMGLFDPKLARAEFNQLIPEGGLVKSA